MCMCVYKSFSNLSISSLFKMFFLKKIKIKKIKCSFSSLYQV